MTMQTLLSIRLSFDELQLVMGLVKAPAIHGVRPPGRQPVTAEQAAYGLLCAERSLRARELATLSPEGTLVAHVALLSAVGVCGYPERALLLQHVTPLNELVEYAGAQRGEASVGLRAVEPGVYQLAVQSEPDDLIEHALDVAGCGQLVAAPGGALLIEDATLARIRALAEEGAVDAAREQLCAMGAAAGMANALAAVLSEPHALSVFTRLRRAPDSSFDQESITVLHADGAAWSMTAVAEQSDYSLLAPIDTAALREQLLQSFEAPTPAAA